jgi:ADP-ribosylglycohydrolase
MKATNNETIDRCQGALLGLAVGDAVGTTLEFRQPGSFEPIDDMIGDGPFGLKPGQWTDDTSMALCLATSLVECRGFDARDQMVRYCRWWREGYLSSTGVCFDIGSTVRESLKRFEDTGEPFSGSADPHSAGNGSLMRLVPIPLFYAEDPGRAIEMAGESSRTTHGAPAAVDACRYFAGLIIGAIRGATKEELLSPLYSPSHKCWEKRPLCLQIREVAEGSFKRKSPPAIQGAGYVVKSIEAALWAFHGSKDFREGCLMAANLGDDADTTAAVYGQIAGAFYGTIGIPPEWLERLHDRDEIIGLGDRLAVGSRKLN